MESIDASEKKVVVMEENVADTEKELCETEIRASEVGEFWELKKHVDGRSKSIIHSAIKLGEAGSCLASIHQKVEAVCHGEA